MIYIVCILAIIIIDGLSSHNFVTMFRRKSPLVVQVFLAVVLCTGIVMLVVQMHVLHLHLSDFSNSIDRYMDQQQEFFHRFPQQDAAVSDNSVDDEEDLKPILRILELAGHDIHNDKEIKRPSLPKWSKIFEAYGPPNVLGLESCQAYLDSVEPNKRTLGVAGLFNTGTNLLYALLDTNCRNNQATHSRYNTIQWQVRF
jgi:hypothetical protein